MQRKSIVSKESGAKSDGSFDIIISTEAVDRDGDVIMQGGWDFENYNVNPVVMLNHNYSDLPIGKTNSLRIEKGQTIANFSFREPANDNDPVNFVRSAWEQGHIQAASVGFRVTESENLNKDEEEDDFWFFPPQRFLKQELLEWSIVTIPANQEALRLGMKGMITPPVAEYKQDDSEIEVLLLKKKLLLLQRIETKGA